MQLPTCTSIWKTKRIFYKVEDIRLPVPVPADMLLLTLICFTMWCGFWWVTIGVTPFKAILGANSWFGAAVCWYLIPPFFAARVMSRPNREGKNVMQAAASQWRYLIRPRIFDGFVSRRHIQAWLRARETRARITGIRETAISRVTGSLRRRMNAVQSAAQETVWRLRAAFTAVTERTVTVFTSVAGWAASVFRIAAQRGRTFVQDTGRKRKTVTGAIVREAAQAPDAARAAVTAVAVRAPRPARKPEPRHAATRNQPDDPLAMYRRIYLGEEVQDNESTAKR